MLGFFIGLVVGLAGGWIGHQRKAILKAKASAKLRDLNNRVKEV